MKQGQNHFWSLGILIFCFLLLYGCAQKEVATEMDPDLDKRVETEAAPEDEYLTEPGVEADPEELERMEEFRIQEEERKKAKAAEEEKELQEMKQKLQQRIHFAFDSYELRPEARDVLREKAKLLKNNHDLQIVIEGHCDERGTAEYNLALGERRARAAYEFLILLGVDPDRLSIISYGEERPLERASTEEAWAKNRRAEFRVFR